MPVINIELTQNSTAMVDLEDADLQSLKWHLVKGYKRGDPDYAMTGLYIGVIDGKKKVQHIKMHRAVMARALGRDLLPHEIVDHRDGNTLNNCRANLRLCTPSQNAQNRKHRGSISGYKGVQYRKNTGRYVARIKLNGKWSHLGTFDTAEEAYGVYCEAAKRMFGEFARLA